MKRWMLILVGLAGILAGCSRTMEYDLLIRGGTVYDGSGGAPRVADVAVNGDTIVAIDKLDHAKGKVEVDAAGLAVAPGFINMLSWANESLIYDGRGQSDIRQGVTLEVMGEGHSMGPLTDAMKQEMRADQAEIKYDIEWTTLGEYLDYLAKRGISPNVASFVGAATIRMHELGHANRAPTPEELERMQALVRQAMEEGAMGLSTALIYEPGAFAKTDEVVALAKVAGEHGGMYISHLRDEGANLLEAFEELVEISRRAKLPAEVYHLKASGPTNWGKLDELIRRIDAYRAEGLPITADMYTYNASFTGLNAAMPPWVRQGGQAAWVERLKDPEIRARVKQAMDTPSTDWDNGYLCAGSPDNILLVGFKNPKLRPLTGKTLAEIAKMRGTSPEETAMDLVIEDNSPIDTVFFSMSEDNIKKKIKQPWMSFCSDTSAPATEGLFLERSAHPRAYGTFARLLGKYVREEKLITLQEAIRQLTSLPAGNLKLDRRGRLEQGYYADIVVFDPKTIQDHATFEKPHQYATGVIHVFVNGVQVLRNGEHTGASPGRVVRGPGWRGQK